MKNRREPGGFAEGPFPLHQTLGAYYRLWVPPWETRPTMPNYEEPPLQPLRLPTGWVVTFNTFYEVDAQFRSWDDTSVNFKEDMLLLSNPYVPVIIDLGWMPSFRSTGRFYLRAIRVEVKDGSDWDKPLRQLTTRSRRKVVAALEEWLAGYSANGLGPLRGKKS